MWTSPRLVQIHSTLHSPTHSTRLQQCVTHLTTWTPVDSTDSWTLVDSILLYATILVNKEASNDNMLVIDASCMPEGATELILTG